MEYGITNKLMSKTLKLKGDQAMGQTIDGNQGFVVIAVGPFGEL